MPTRPIFTVAAMLLALAAPPARAQEPWAPASGWERWLGLEPGQTLVYESSGGARTCTMVGNPIRLGGGLWLPLDRLPWPGFASDSRVLLPLTGAPRLGTIRTPGPRPRLDLLLPAADSLRLGPPLPRPDETGPRGSPGEGIQDPPPPLRYPAQDGWYAVGDPRDPAYLVYVRCSMCLDARLRVVFARGKGIVSLTSTTIAGPEGFRLVEGGCAEMEEEGAEFEVYVIPRQPPP